MFWFVRYIGSNLKKKEKMKNGKRLSFLSLVVITEQKTKKYMSMFWWLQQENNALKMDLQK